MFWRGQTYRARGDIWDPSTLLSAHYYRVRTFSLVPHFDLRVSGESMTELPDYPTETVSLGTDNLNPRQASRLWYRRAEQPEVAQFTPAPEQYQKRTTGLLAPGALEQSPRIESLEDMFIAPTAS